MGYLICCSADSFEENFKYEYTDFFDREHIQLISQEEEPERDAIVYHYWTGVATQKKIHYKIVDGSKTIYIQEEYNLSVHDNITPISETVPYGINFWGMDNGAYFYGVILDSMERPSVEWLSSFGLEPYISSSTE